MMGIVLNREGPQSLQLQLTAGLRSALRGSIIPPGEKLPPTRILAGELGVSRNLVLSAYDQLIAEGYLSGHVGRGTFATSHAQQRETADGLGEAPRFS